MTKKSFIAGLFLLGISITAFAKSNETVKSENSVSINNNIIEVIDQSGGGNGNGSGTGNGGGNGGGSGTVFIPIKPPKPPVFIK